MSDGSIERYKSKLVIRGDSQQDGIDYTETFSPVVTIITIKCLLTFAIKHNWFVLQLDLNNVFLHGDLHEEVYMKIPLGLTVTTTSSDPPLAFYVDDILLAGSDYDKMDALKSFLDQQFKIKDLGSLHYFLGLEVTKVPQGYVVNQYKYTRDLIQEFHSLDVKPVLTPLDSHTKLSSYFRDPLLDPSLYRRLIGKLNFFQHTRPDMSFSVQYLRHFLISPKVPHKLVALYVLRYLLNVPSQDTLLSNTTDFSLQAYSDSDWAACPISRKSVTRYYIVLGSSPISWKSKKQQTVSLSFVEVEYRALGKVVAEVTCQVALHIAKNLVFQYHAYRGRGKDAVLRPPSVEEEEEASVPKSVKDNKRKRASDSEDPKPKTRMDRKPKKNTIPLTIESVLCLRDEDEDDEEENDGSVLVARVKKTIDAPKGS
ncbi:uncharacterized mitochondrial protein AtMg00810-like [Nicotiana tomentosiformis]|uniref:uncharacterized mitochondrial protein AtMg00810-like n=1 Tax=Nicotiana tomentosiformis TaxID=4098 RepID=UPI00388C5A1A